MSVWFLTKKHIDYMVTALIAAEYIPPGQANRTGALLWSENLQSYRARYGYDDDFPAAAKACQFYAWKETPVLTAGALAKTAACYRYQACESLTWGDSRARALTEDLLTVAEHQGWVPDDHYPADVPWGWPDWGEEA